LGGFGGVYRWTRLHGIGAEVSVKSLRRIKVLDQPWYLRARYRPPRRRPSEHTSHVGQDFFSQSFKPYENQN
jgi:hypothetical protein